MITMEVSGIVLLVSLVLLLLLSSPSSLWAVHDHVYIVYMGEARNNWPHNNNNNNIEHQQQQDDHHALMITSVLGSKEAAEEAILYTYSHGFSGFAAKLTPSQAQQISELPEVVHVTRNRIHKMETTRSWDFLFGGPSSSLQQHHDDLLSRTTNMGDGIIIGILDSGIWPESRSFNDEGLGPIPSSWKGYCESGEKFNSSSRCNRKLIGAKSFGKAVEKHPGVVEYMSPRDTNGHGTHVSAIAAGSFIHNASYNGFLAPGMARGGAPRARIAMYKVCWYKGACASADILKGFDEAIGDGVHVLSLSLGDPKLPLPTSLDHEPNNVNTAINLGAFHAVTKGIPVILAAGNNGPYGATVVHVAPWIITVASSTVDRAYPAVIRLIRNNETLIGQAMNIGKEIISHGLHFEPSCEEIGSSMVFKGKVVLCFYFGFDSSYDLVESVTMVSKSGGVAIVIAKNPTDLALITSSDCLFAKIPCIQVDYEIGSRIKNYYLTTTTTTSSSSPALVSIGVTETLVGKPIAPKIAFTSSRGPSSITPAILKPDIAAPGVNIVAQTSPMNEKADSQGFAMFSGTSMAAPHVAGVVALLKAAHSDWSPAAIRSALVTTASITHESGGLIYAQGLPRKLADPFDYGGGIVNPNGAVDPGLVYDMESKEYLDYLCVMDYNKIMTCSDSSSTNVSLLDLNMPSFSIPNFGIKSTTVTTTRTVTNVGGLYSTYKVLVDNPQGLSIVVTPDVLVFTPVVRKITFMVTFSYSDGADTKMNEGGYDFGYLTWTDGVHIVRSPIAVRKQVLEYYTDVN